MHNSFNQNNVNVVKNILSKIFPIKRKELGKFIPMASMLFMVLLNYNLVRLMKDGVVITLIGAEVINFIKLWVETPSAALFVIIYSKMCNVTTQERAFRYISYFFLGYFVLFGFVLFPYNNYINLSDNISNALILSFPHLKWFILMAAKWSYVLLYVLGEMWPVVIGTFLFWQLANKLTTTQEAPRFYSFYKFFGLFSLIFVGITGEYITSEISLFRCIFTGANDILPSCGPMRALSFVIGVSGLFCIFIQQYMEKKFVLKQNKTPEVLSLSIKESAKIILSSKVLWLIMLIILSYHVVITLIEGMWFFKVRELYPYTEQFIHYQSRVMYYCGISSIICAYFGNILMQRMGWRAGALATPITILLVGTAFFIFVIWSDYLGMMILNIFHVSIPILSLVVMSGTVQNVLIKGVRYSIYDASREILYIDMDKEIKTKGKAATDMLGSKLGKSAGATAQMIIFTLYPMSNYNSIAPLLMVILIITCILWIQSVNSLKKNMNLT